jgi:hypothetical protein
MSGAGGGAGRQEVHLMICVDGTHGGFIYMSDADYDREFAGSHVRKVAHLAASGRFGANRTLYLRGPHAPGSEFSVEPIFYKALAFIEQQAGAAAPSGIALHLCGYSRGGAIALDLANIFGSPPDGFLAVLRRSVSPGRSSRLDERLSAVRRLLGARVRVARLVMFDAVDMSYVLDGAPIAADIGTVAHVIRGRKWGSRQGWGNCGLELAEGSDRPGFSVPEINGTHAALGGLPGMGDTPKELVRAILELAKRHPGKVDWQAAERVYRGIIPRAEQVRAAVGTPGTFVNWKTGGLLDAPGKRVIEATQPYQPAAARLGMAPPRPVPKLPVLPPQGQRSAPPRPAGTPPPRPRPAPPIEETLRTAMKAYVEETATPPSLRHDWLNSKLEMKGRPGSFASIGAFFANSHPDVGALVFRYRAQDDKASMEAWTKILAQAGSGFPAGW